MYPYGKENQMGLDMYLYASNYTSGTDFGRDAEGNFTKDENPEFARILESAGLTKDDIFAELPSVEMKFKVGYWRKANQIHNWFVANVQDGEDECKYHYVPREKLEELREVCREVMADHSKAGELLPVGEGFFFGSSEYDDWYFEQVEETVKLLDRLLVNPKFEFGGFEFGYQSSW
jgi:hypothetical protein